jgi:hypothetical protein
MRLTSYHPLARKLEAISCILDSEPNITALAQQDQTQAPNRLQPPEWALRGQVKRHSERRWNELPQAAAKGSRLFAPNFLLASIVSKNNSYDGLHRKK